MSPLWYWRYIPCAGVKLEFDEFKIYQINGRPVVHLTRADPTQKRRQLKKHILEDQESLYREVPKRPDFEIALASVGGDGIFKLDYVHVFFFLLIIRTGGWVSAPAVLTHSTLDDLESDAPHVFCTRLLDVSPAYYGDCRLTLEDAQWISLHMDAALALVDKPKFQNAMQALTSFHCIPFASVCLLVAWSGLEALFGVEQEISFRLSLYIANYLKFGDARRLEFERLRRSYDDRSRVAHGAATKARLVQDNALYTRDVLRECLQRCIETGAFPDAKNLIF